MELSSQCTSTTIHRSKTIEDVGVVTYLHQACLCKIKAVTLAEELIKAGAAINATEGNGRTPLILATQMNDPEMVELFLKYKADVMHIDMEYNNALKYTIPGEACYKMIRKAMNLQPKTKEGTGLIDGRLRTSQKLRRDSKVKRNAAPVPIRSSHSPIQKNKIIG